MIKIIRANEFQRLEDEVTTRRNEMEKAVTFIQAIEKLQWNSVFSERMEEDQSILARALHNLRNKLYEFSTTESRRAWVSRNISQTVEVLQRNSGSVEQLCDSFLKQIVTVMNANQGAVFLHDRDVDDEHLILYSAYAYGKKKIQDNRIPVGSGMMGQFFLESGITQVTEVPKDYIKITSGLGEALPRCLLFIPLQCENERVGMIELASFEKAEPHQLEFLETVGENAGRTLQRARELQRNQKLLHQSESLREHLNRQQDELRRSLETLQAIREDMSRKNRELESSRVEMKHQKEEIENMNRLIESKLDTQRTLYELQIAKLQRKIKEMRIGLPVS
jgi:methyl-accepting chemotaxis protein